MLAKLSKEVEGNYQKILTGSIGKNTYFDQILCRYNFQYELISLSLKSLTCMPAKKLCPKPVPHTSNPKNQPYARRAPGTLRPGNCKFWQQAVSSKSPLVKRAKFFSGEYKECWSADTSGSLAPAWRGVGKP